MELFVDPSPISCRELEETEMSVTTGGAWIITAVTAVVKCGSSFGAVVIAIVDVAKNEKALT